jgi:hypothetical protein
MEIKLRLTRRRVAIIVVLAGLVSAGVAYATIPDSAGVYTACMLNKVGTIRIIDPATQRCSASLESQITFNAKGTKGDPGAPGAPGTPGQSVTSSALAVGDANCPTGGTKFTSSSGDRYACNGAKGDKGDPGSGGAKGDKGDKGDPGGAFIGSACSTGGGATGGTVQMSVASSGAISLTCAGAGAGGGGSGGGECTPPVHSNGVGQTYTLPCPGALGVPGDASTYTLAMATAAAKAWAPDGTLSAPGVCSGGAGSNTLTMLKGSGSALESASWSYSGPLAGHVFLDVTGSGFCPFATDPTWN